MPFFIPLLIGVGAGAVGGAVVTGQLSEITDDMSKTAKYATIAGGLYVSYLALKSGGAIK